MDNGLELPQNTDAAAGGADDAEAVDKEAARGKDPDANWPSSFHALLASSIGFGTIRIEPLSSFYMVH